MLKIEALCSSDKILLGLIQTDDELNMFTNIVTVGLYGAYQES